MTYADLLKKLAASAPRPKSAQFIAPRLECYENEQGEFVWRTIGAVDHHGGSPVQINKGTGVIEKGNPKLVGKKPSEIKTTGSTGGSNKEPPKPPSPIASGGEPEKEPEKFRGRTVIGPEKHFTRAGKGAAEPGEVFKAKSGTRYVVTKASSEYVTEDMIEDMDAWADYPEGKGHYTHFTARPVEPTAKEKAEDAAADKARKDEEAAKQEAASKVSTAKERLKQANPDELGWSVAMPDIKIDWQKTPEDHPWHGVADFVGKLPDGREIAQRNVGSGDMSGTIYDVPADFAHFGRIEYAKKIGYGPEEAAANKYSDKKLAQAILDATPDEKAELIAAAAKKAEFKKDEAREQELYKQLNSIPHDSPEYDRIENERSEISAKHRDSQFGKLYGFRSDRAIKRAAEFNDALSEFELFTLADQDKSPLKSLESEYVKDHDPSHIAAAKQIAEKIAKRKEPEVEKPAKPRKPAQPRASSPGSQIFPFGKHRGRKISEIPTSYLNWALGIDLNPKLRRAVEEYLGKDDYSAAGEQPKMTYAELLAKLRGAKHAQFAAEEYPSPKPRKFAGLDVMIENPAGSIRSGVSKSGKPWATLLKNDYGEIRRHIAEDGENLDIFLGPDESAKDVYVVHQNDPETGKYDEDKVVAGVRSVDEAKRLYLSNYDEEGPRMYRSCTVIPLEKFKAMLTKGEPGGVHWKKKHRRDHETTAMFSTEWDESKHPRGGFKENRGGFSPKTGGNSEIETKVDDLADKLCRSGWCSKRDRVDGLKSLGIEVASPEGTKLVNRFMKRQDEIQAKLQAERNAKEAERIKPYMEEARELTKHDGDEDESESEKEDRIKKMAMSLADEADEEAAKERMEKEADEAASKDYWEKTNAINDQAKAVQQALGEELIAGREDGISIPGMKGSAGGSMYGSFRGLKIRVSDHPSVPGGGFNLNTQERMGEPDVDFVVTNQDDMVKDAEEIRRRVADALMRRGDDDAEEFSSSSPIGRLKLAIIFSAKGYLSTDKGGDFKASEDDLVWRTVGAKGKPPHGGVPVQMHERSGQITKGPKAMKGHTPADLPKPQSKQPHGKITYAQLKKQLRTPEAKEATSIGGKARPPHDLETELKSSLGLGRLTIPVGPDGKVSPHLDEAYRRLAAKHGIQVGEFAVDPKTGRATAKVDKPGGGQKPAGAVPPPLPGQKQANPAATPPPLPRQPGTPPPLKTSPAYKAMLEQMRKDHAKASALEGQPTAEVHNAAMEKARQDAIAKMRSDHEKASRLEGQEPVPNVPLAEQERRESAETRADPHGVPQRTPPTAPPEPPTSPQGAPSAQPTPTPAEATEAGKTPAPAEGEPAQPPESLPPSTAASDFLGSDVPQLQTSAHPFFDKKKGHPIGEGPKPVAEPGQPGSQQAGPAQPGAAPGAQPAMPGAQAQQPNLPTDTDMSGWMGLDNKQEQPNGMQGPGPAPEIPGIVQGADDASAAPAQTTSPIDFPHQHTAADYISAVKADKEAKGLPVHVADIAKAHEDAVAKAAKEGRTDVNPDALKDHAHIALPHAHQQQTPEMESVQPEQGGPAPVAEPPTVPEDQQPNDYRARRQARMRELMKQPGMTPTKAAATAVKELGADPNAVKPKMPVSRNEPPSSQQKPKPSQTQGEPSQQSAESSRPMDSTQRALAKRKEQAAQQQLPTQEKESVAEGSPAADTPPAVAEDKNPPTTAAAKTPAEEQYELARQAHRSGDMAAFEKHSQEAYRLDKEAEGSDKAEEDRATKAKAQPAAKKKRDVPPSKAAIQQQLIDAYKGESGHSPSTRSYPPN